MKVKCHHLAELRDLDMHTSPQTSAQVRRAGEDVTKVLIPHELIFILPDQIFNL